MWVLAPCKSRTIAAPAGLLKLEISGGAGLANATKFLDGARRLWQEIDSLSRIRRGSLTVSDGLSAIFRVFTDDTTPVGRLLQYGSEGVKSFLGNSIAKLTTNISIQGLQEFADRFKIVTEISSIFTFSKGSKVANAISKNLEILENALKIVSQGEIRKERLVDALNTIADESNLLSAITTPNQPSQLNILRSRAIIDARSEAALKSIFIHSDDDAEAYLNFAARQQGISPDRLDAVTLGDDIFIRKIRANNPRILREEMIHVEQQRARMSTADTTLGEIDARVKILNNYKSWGISEQESWEMFADIGQMRRTGRY